MISYITKEDKNSFGNFFDRKNNYDDGLEISKFTGFAKNFYNEEYEFRAKPFGDYDVDIGIYKQDTLVSTVDVERWSQWDEEWPSQYKYISFLGRKEKFLKRPQDFAMVYFNNSLNKILTVTKKDILKYPTEKKFFARFNKYDLVRQIPFDFGRLYGKNLTDKEKQLFKNYSDREYFV